MRLTCLLTLLALLVATLGAPAGLLCHAGAAAQATPALTGTCCGGGSCHCQDDCTCFKQAPQSVAGNQAIPAPTSNSNQLLLAMLPATTAPLSPDAGPAAFLLTPDDWRGPMDGHASCLSNRAPPLS